MVPICGLFLASAAIAGCEDFGGTYMVCSLEEEQEIIQAARDACDGGLPSGGVLIIYPDDCPAPGW